MEEEKYILFNRLILKGTITFLSSFYQDSTLWYNKNKSKFVEFINSKGVIILAKCPVLKSNINEQFIYNIPHRLKDSLENIKSENVYLYFNEKENFITLISSESYDVEISYENNNSLSSISDYKIEEEGIGFLNNDLQSSDSEDDEKISYEYTFLDQKFPLKYREKDKNHYLFYSNYKEVFPTKYLNEKKIYSSINYDNFRDVIGVSNINFSILKKFIKVLSELNVIKFTILDDKMILLSEGGPNSKKIERQFSFINIKKRNLEFLINVKDFEKLKGLNISMDIIQNNKNKKIFKSLEIKVVAKIKGLTIFPGNLQQEKKDYYNNYFIFIPAKD